MQKFKNWLLVAIAFAIVPFIKTALRHGGMFDDWTQIFLLPIALIAMYACMYLVGFILGVAILSANIAISYFCIKKDDGLGLYEFLNQTNKDNFLLETLFSPLKRLLRKYWDTLRINQKFEIFISSFITLCVLLYLLWCWGILRL